MSALAPPMSTQQALALPSPAPSNTVVINARCSLRIDARSTRDRRRRTTGASLSRSRTRSPRPMRWCSWWSRAYAQQTDVAGAFAVSVRTIRRDQERYADGGMAALGREEGWRRGRRRISGKRLRSIEMLKSKGMSNRAIAHRLGVNEKAIRKLVGPSKPTESAQLAFTSNPA